MTEHQKVVKKQCFTLTAASDNFEPEKPGQLTTNGDCFARRTSDTTCKMEPFSLLPKETMFNGQRMGHAGEAVLTL